MYYLNTLWRYLEDAMPTYRRDGEYKELMEQITALEEELKTQISEEAWRCHERLSDREADLAELDRREIFLYGFRTGARIILDVVGEYRGERFLEG